MTVTPAILDRDLFVQAFWAKSREVLRPELDRAVDRLRERGLEGDIASQEYDATDARDGDSGPSLTLSIRVAADQTRPRLAFYGDVVLQRVLVFAGRRKTATAYTLDQLGELAARDIVRDWEARLRL
jgi:hypothetical protein